MTVESDGGARTVDRRDKSAGVEVLVCIEGMAAS